MTTVFEIIRTDSFDSLWFWVLVALIWVLVGNQVLGVPWDMVQHMRRDASVSGDVETLVRITAERHVSAGFDGGSWVWALVSCVLTVLGLTGFYYGQSLAQAAFLILAPLSLIWGLTIRAAGHYLEQRPSGDALYRFLRRHHRQVQVITLLAVVAVSLWGGVQTVLHSRGY